MRAVSVRVPQVARQCSGVMEAEQVRRHGAGGLAKASP